MGTVFENVANGISESQRMLREDKQRDLVQIACETSNAHGFISKLPNVCRLNPPMPRYAKLIILGI